MTVKTHIIRIGNSQGIRIPKLLLEQSGISGDVELEVDDNKIVIHAVAEPRSGWGEAFAEMAEHGEEELLEPDAPATEWDEEEWQWD